MPEYIETPTIITIQVTLSPGYAAAEAFVDWQTRLYPIIAAQPGFVSVEFLSPHNKQRGWLVVQRFSDVATAAAWRSSLACQRFLEDLKAIAVPDGVKEVEADESTVPAGVTEVIIVETVPGKEAAFREWAAKIHQLEATYPGFRGAYVQSPQLHKGKYWVTLLQFDKMENLDRWLHAPEREKLIREGASLIKSIETQRVISPYAGWFASIAKTGEMPSVWQQTMIVLLVLFPIVMLEFKYLSPFTKYLDISLGTFIGNAVSVSLIAFPMVPLVSHLLRWWLIPSCRNRTVSITLGTLLVCLLYILEIIFFWNFI